MNRVLFSTGLLVCLCAPVLSGMQPSKNATDNPTPEQPKPAAEAAKIAPSQPAVPAASQPTAPKVAAPENKADNKKPGQTYTLPTLQNAVQQERSNKIMHALSQIKETFWPTIPAPAMAVRENISQKDVPGVIKDTVDQYLGHEDAVNNQIQDRCNTLAAWASFIACSATCLYALKCGVPSLSFKNVIRTLSIIGGITFTKFALPNLDGWWNRSTLRTFTKEMHTRNVLTPEMQREAEKFYLLKSADDQSRVHQLLEKWRTQ